MKKTSTFLFFLCSIMIFSTSLNAQNFLWGRSCGSSESSGGADDEKVRDIATDKNGNVYLLTGLKSTSRNIIGIPQISFGNQDIVLASFKPDGSLRWSKIIGSNLNDFPVAVRTDGSNGIYIMSYVISKDNDGQIDVDATITQTEQTLVLTKYDINGNYQWHKLPQSDTVTFQ